MLVIISRAWESIWRFWSFVILLTRFLFLFLFFLMIITLYFKKKKTKKFLFLKIFFLNFFY